MFTTAIIDSLFSSDIKVISVGIDIIFKLLTLIATFAGGGFALYQWHKNVQINRARLINELLNTFYRDDEISKWTVLFDYEGEESELSEMEIADMYGFTEEWTRLKEGNIKIEDVLKSNNFFLSLDRYLYFVNYLMYLIKHGFLKKKEQEFFRYDIDNLRNSRRLLNYTEYVKGLSQNPKYPDNKCEYPFCYIDKDKHFFNLEAIGDYGSNNEPEHNTN